MRELMNKLKARRRNVQRASALFCAACVLCLLFTPAAPAKAAQSGTPYAYKVRIYAGRQGTISGGEVLVYDSVAYGSQVMFNQNQVQLFDNSKYYIKGLKKSGEDNSEAQQIPAFKVTEDQDYVVAYGILGDAVSYVINYEDENGNTLAPSETYYGNVGDKPVIAYLYIEGYRPQAYNLTRTLSENAAENVFTFVYYPLSAGGEPAPGEDLGGGTGGGTGTAPGETPPAGGGVLPPEALPPGGDAAAPGGNAGVAGADAPGGADGPGGPGGADAPGPGGDDGPGPEGDDDLANVPDDEVPLDEGPEDLVDLDDDEVPLALPDFLRIDSDARILGIPAAAVAVSGAVLIGCLLWLILKKKKEKEKERA